MNVAADQKKKTGKRREKNGRPISKKLNLPFSNRSEGSTAKVWFVLYKGALGVTGTLRKANSHFDSNLMDSETTSPC